MIEAELKARLRKPDAVRGALAARADAEVATYRDVYYDRPDESLDRGGRELRVRSVETGGPARHLLTFKEPAVDAASGSKPEYETTIGDRSAVDHLLRSLGFVPLVELTKECENYRLSAAGRDFLATLVRVPEIEGTFLEVETMAAESDVDQALAAVRGLLNELGVSQAELTAELYTDAVRATRPGR